MRSAICLLVGLQFVVSCWFYVNERGAVQAVKPINMNYVFLNFLYFGNACSDRVRSVWCSQRKNARRLSIFSGVLYRYVPVCILKPVKN